MKNKLIYLLIIFIIIIMLCIYFISYQNILNLYNKNISTNLINESLLEASTDKKIMLADILKEENEIIITEDNIDNTDKIIKRANIQTGIFITEHSREKFLEIINISTENNYSIDIEGYLKKPTSITKENDLTTKINNCIDSNKTIVINISNTYKGFLNGMLLDFMIERTMYIQTFYYNNNIQISIINPDRINEQSKDLTQKQIYEEILLGI